ncbi:MAG: tRNA (N6-isopentenyl adenosine(37)-C2)-methylthiotransferase MiaB [Calditrichaeota bacterium]|nr:tRNA (N6-isopentenyl adenosine(37)-C2)-methylthiotransferase MiaB [Calditrichota bacterium]
MSEAKPKTFYIKTYGCQMNKYDSELVAGLLRQHGVAAPEDADVILVNTCAVREHAEQRVLGHLTQLRLHKQADPARKIGVLGCMAERMGDDLIARRPFVDFVLGPDGYRKLPALLGFDEQPEWEENAEDRLETYTDIFPAHTEGVAAWIAVMRGCNNFCSYCIVPYVRGRERSRPAADVVKEVRRLAEQGYLEVTLLGQNVNSYWDGEHDFSDLLKMVASVDGIVRVRFATSHPKDLSDKLIDTIASEPKVCNHVHLPVQSGSSRILRLMNRKYTREQYLERVERIRQAIPDVALTTDVIVGFPGETEEDFEQTRSLLEQVEYDGAFVFHYSVRPGTAAARLPDSVPREEKIARLEELNRLQKKISLKKNRALVGRVEEVLVEGPNRKRPGQYIGRTETNKIVVFSPTRKESRQGLVRLRIVDASAHTLFGRELDGAEGETASAVAVAAASED